MRKLRIEALDPGAQAMQMNVDIAHEISELAGMIYSSIYYMCRINESNENVDVFFDGKYWTYRSVRAMQEKQYPWATEKQIRGALNKLIKAGHLLERKAPGLVRNNTSLYTVGS